MSTIPQHTWVSKLFGYAFQVEYKPGRQYVATDALSRRDEQEVQARVHAISRLEFELLDEFRREAEMLPEIIAKRHELRTAWLEPPGL
jgi:hypothetical protein